MIKSTEKEKGKQYRLISFIPDPKLSMVQLQEQDELG
jgi:hypothetical protein